MIDAIAMGQIMTEQLGLCNTAIVQQQKQIISIRTESVVGQKQHNTPQECSGAVCYCWESQLSVSFSCLKKKMINM